MKLEAMTKSQLVFDPFSEEFFDGPYEIYRRMRQEAPVYYNEQYDFYALSRHADVVEAFKDFQTYSSAHGIDLATIRSGQPAEPRSIIFMDPPEHRRMRSLVNKVAQHRHAERSGRGNQALRIALGNRLWRKRITGDHLQSDRGAATRHRGATGRRRRRKDRLTRHGRAAGAR